MKTWILSSDSEIPSTKRLVAAFKKSKFETEVLNPLELQFEFGRKSTTLFHQGRPKNLPDLVLPRLGWNTLDYGLKLSRFFESAGVAVINSADSLALASDKLSSLQVFHELGLPVPQTRFAHLTAPTDYHLFGERKSHVFKTLQGSQGFGVTWSFEKRQSQAQVDAYRTVSAPVLVQEMIEESFGEDVRVLVIKGEILASMKRKGSKQELRSNLHQDGSARPTRLSKEEQELALNACEALGLFYAGVDFLRTTKGPLLLEANPSPGFEGISETSKMDLASLFVKSIASLI